MFTGIDTTLISEQKKQAATQSAMQSEAAIIGADTRSNHHRLEDVVGEGARVKLDAPFKLARAQLESGEWLLKIEILDPKLLSLFQEIVRRGANTFDAHRMPVLRELIDGIVVAPITQPLYPVDPVMTITQLHDQTFAFYAAFQKHKEKQMPLPMMKMHMVLGLSGELLELMQALAIDDPKEKRVNVEEELGDMLFFLHGLRNHYGLSPFTNNGLADNSLFKTLGNPVMELLNNVEALVTLVKKDVISEKDVNRELFTSHVRACELWMAYIAKTIGMQLCQLAESNMSKLNKRYKDKFTTSEAQARADKDPQS